jgi:hypothetical protein
MDDPTALVSLWNPAFRAVGIGWTLHRQNGDYLESRYYQEIEAPLDSCWLLGGMIGDSGRSIAYVALTRPRSAHPFVADDVQRLDRLRPWLAHAFRPSPREALEAEQTSLGTAGPALLSGQMIVTPDASIVYQTARLEHLLRMLAGEPGNYTRYMPAHDRAPDPILKLLRQITGAANGSSNTPPYLQISTAHGVLTLDAKWLVPPGAIPADVAKNPKGCLIAVTVELREHAIAHAARVLRDSGATPAQVKVGIHLALGKTKPVIAGELGLQLSSVADLTKKLYQNLDIHNSTELGLKVWLGQRQYRAGQPLWRAG